MKLQGDIPLAPQTTFRMGPNARYFIEIEQPEDLPDAFAFIRENGLPFFVLGGGSNTIFSAPEHFEGVVLKMAIPGFEITAENEASADVRAGAGESWDGLVATCVSHDFSGIEAMSAIPGSVGAAPIQNIGAYGQELDQLFLNAEVYDYQDNSFKTLSKDDCHFSYRDSIFKHENRYIVTSITLRLSKDKPRIPNYPDPIAYFESRSISEPSLQQIREAIIEIRKNKLPDPKEVASVGSFFKNPFVSADVVQRLRSEYERTVIFPQADGRFKVGAGWLIEMLGYKGKSFGTLSLYKNHALVIVNNGGATFSDLADLVRHLQGEVRARFGINIEPEPVFV